MVRGVSWWHAVGDIAMIGCGFYLAHLIRFETGWIAAPLGAISLGLWMLLALSSLPLWLLIAALHGLYYTKLKQSFTAELGSLTHAAAEGLLATILLTFSIRGLPDSRLALLLAVAISWLGLTLYRWLTRRLLRTRPLAAVVGESPLAGYLRRQIGGGSTRFDLAAAHGTASELDLAGIDVVFCDADQAGELWQRLPDGPPEAAVHLLPEAGATGAAGLTVATVEGVPTLAVKSASDLAAMRRIKRIVDITGALILLALTSPLWLVCVIAIGVSMPGPLFFTHQRLGLFAKPFKLLKFRSMVKNAEQLQADLEGFDEAYKLKHDPRITPWGKVMRRLSLDELPQLINILRGELSLVGPRPVVETELEKYGFWSSLLMTVPPGLTGLWQVSGRSDVSYQQRIDFDLYYINNWSLGLDLLILLRTFPAVLSRRGAY
jgi:exopolysaccharide biosynthesis polyprenyl glycosylphosphotransferase